MTYFPRTASKYEEEFEEALDYLRDEEKVEHNRMVSYLMEESEKIELGTAGTIINRLSDYAEHREYDVDIEGSSTGSWRLE